MHLLLIMCTGCCRNVKAERNDALFPLFLVTHSMQQILNYTKNLKFKINCTKNFFTGASIPHQGWGILQWISGKSGLTKNVSAKSIFCFYKCQGRPGEFSWDDKTAGAQLLLWELTQVAPSFNNKCWACSIGLGGLLSSLIILFSGWKIQRKCSGIWIKSNSRKNGIFVLWYC